MTEISGYEWSVRWDTHTFSEDDAKEIATALNLTTKTTTLLQPHARYAALVDVFLALSVYYIGISVAEFIKNCSATVGKRAGEALSNDLVAGYSKIKNLLIDKLNKNKSEKGFQCVYEMKLEGFTVKAVVHGTSQEAGLIGHSIDCLGELVSLSASVLSDFDSSEDVDEIRVVFDGTAMQWKPIFLVTKESIYEIAET